MKMEWVSLSTVIFPLFFSLSLSNPDFPILLTFKSSADQFESLSSWSNSSDPCSSWLGVQCHPSTRRVTRLVLDYLNLTGSIYPLTLLSHLRLLSLKHNRLSLSSPAATAAAALDLSSWPHLKHLYLSHNLFAGKFPSGAASLHRLRRLDLSHNYFFGHIPMTELTQLPHLITLRLEANSFTGTLNSDDPPPPSTLSVFNVSGNDLVGGIPEWLSWLPESSFSGNNHLCGKPLPNSCPHPIARKRSPDCMPSNPTTNKRNIHNRVVVMIVSIDAIAILAALVTVTWICHRCTRGRAAATQEKKGRLKRFDSAQREYINYGGVEQNRKMAFFDGCQGIAKVDDLLRASAEMLGMGYVGATYKVMMDGGDVVVVKRVRERLKRREADGLLRVIGGLRHNNIVSLRAFYHSKDELLLVYDFLPNGSLHSLLHGNRGPGRTPLDWTTRLKLASGAAKGLAFLHCYNKSKLFHGHCTSSNIIVDTLGNACVSDIGPRIKYEVIGKTKEPLQMLGQLLKDRFKNLCGIVYCLSKSECVEVSNFLNEKCKIKTVFYHAGLAARQRVAVQKKWHTGEVHVVCATIAFGMGIDKPDVRFVVHNTLSKSIESYYQESGRAGRDNLPAVCIALYQKKDFSRIVCMLRGQGCKNEIFKTAMDQARKMQQYCELKCECRRQALLEHFGESFDRKTCKYGSSPCDNCLKHTS